MPKKPKAVPDKIDPNRLQTRDHLLVRLLTGATKAGTFKDKRREADKQRCRKKVDKDETE